jgi:acetoin utilization protein AcuB
VEGKALVGIVTDRDIRSFLGGRIFGSPEEREIAMSAKVGSVMSGELITVAPDDDLREVVELLIEEKVGGIPVVDGDGGLVGIITHIDVLRYFLTQMIEEGEER